MKKVDKQEMVTQEGVLEGKGFGFRFTPTMAFNRGRIIQLCKDPRCIFRIVEIVFGIICVSLVRCYLLMGGKPDWFLLAFFTPAAYLLITPALAIHQIIEDPLKPPFSELLLDTMGAFLYLSAGMCSIDYYLTFLTLQRFKAAGIAYGFFAIITAFLHIGNCIVSHKKTLSNTVVSVRNFTTKHIHI